MNQPHHPSRTALVLGGGGSTGNAWLIGVVAGLLEAGLDVTTADRIVGTSAGSTAAAQITATDPLRLLSDVLSTPVPKRHADAAGRDGPPARLVADHIARITAIAKLSADAADMRRLIGAAALAADATADRAWQTQWRATVVARLPSPRWPDRWVLITAVDASTGDPVVFDSGSGVDLVDAVAASCSSGRPYWIDGRPYIDGGYRTNAENADLAAGCGRVLVLSPFGGRTLAPVRWAVDLASQVADLRAGGSAVHVISPGREVEHLFGPNAMNAALRPTAARAGCDQGRGLGGELRAHWVDDPDLE